MCVIVWGRRGNLRCYGGRIGDALGPQLWSSDTALRFSQRPPPPTHTHMQSRARAHTHMYTHTHTRTHARTHAPGRRC